MSAAAPARPRPAPPALGGVSWFQNFVRTEDNGRVEVYSLPTGSRACRALMQTLCMNVCIFLVFIFVRMILGVLNS